MTILIYGEKRVGKDTVADLIEEYFKNKGIKPNRYSFASLIKKIICNIKEISCKELEKNKKKYRKYLIWLGEEIKKVYPDFWVKSIIKQLDVTKINIISDCRFEIEYKKIKEIDDVIFIHVIDKNIKEEYPEKFDVENEIIIDNTEKNLNKLKEKINKVMEELNV